MAISASSSADSDCPPTAADIEAKKLSVPEVQQALQRLEREKLVLANKIQELQQDVSEHKLVLDAFAKVTADRKCYRMVGGVLVERSVAEVKPALEDHKQKVEATLEILEKNFNVLLKTHSAYTEKYLQLTGQAAPTSSSDVGATPGTAEKKSVGSAGILV
ncbi:prefoldin subunit 2 [Cystoisospora suis]|uniref:Prefoldin subunit 2 n=1 Tax=Cystoisospora suis TaxID=483139 RepID=A0A2C6LEF7_9APIC|nr:prefoldin subunit 2 [Cystoisospora suis]